MPGHAGSWDVVAVPSPSYPIHIYGPVISGANVRAISGAQHG